MIFVIVAANSLHWIIIYDLVSMSCHNHHCPYINLWLGCATPVQLIMNPHNQYLPIPSLFSSHSIGPSASPSTRNSPMKRFVPKLSGKALVKHHPSLNTLCLQSSSWMWKTCITVSVLLLVIISHGETGWLLGLGLKYVTSSLSQGTIGIRINSCQGKKCGIQWTAMLTAWQWTLFVIQFTAIAF